MTEQDWQELKDAYDFVGKATMPRAKIEMDKWTIYRVGSNVIRIDIKVESK